MLKELIKSLTDEKEPDYLLFLLVSTLIIIGIIFSYSLSIYTVMSKGYGEFHFFIRQLLSGILGIFIMFIFSQIKLEIFVSKVSWTMFVVFGLLVIALPFLLDSLATASGGDKRWIRLSFISISPTEFFKIGFIFFLAYSFNRKLKGISELPIKEEFKLIFPYLLVFLIFILFVAVSQKDLGNTMLIALIIFCMLFFVDVSAKLIRYLFLITFLGLISLIVFFKHRLDRILSWWGSIQDSLLGYLPDSISIYLKVDIATQNRTQKYLSMQPFRFVTFPPQIYLETSN